MTEWSCHDRLSLSIIKQHAIETHSSFPQFSRVNGQLNASASLPLGEMPRRSLDRKLCRTLNGLVVVMKKKCSAAVGLNPGRPSRKMPHYRSGFSYPIK
jgi:hypothetical protein